MSANGAPRVSSDELRAAVRAVLQEVLPGDVLRGGGTGAGGEVVIRDDTDLDALVRRVAEACRDPAQRAALAAGRHSYRLAGAPREPARVAPPAADADALRVERGAVTERTVTRAAAQGSRLVLGRRAVLTPLARDRARSLGVAVEKEG